MAYLIDLETHTDKRGNLTVMEDVLPYIIQRVFYIYGVDHSERGGHRHYKTIQAAVCFRVNVKYLAMMAMERISVFHTSEDIKYIITLLNEFR